MMTLPVIRLGNPILRRRSKTVSINEIHTKQFQTFLDKLAYTCVVHQGVGIAAPQVGKRVRVIVVHVDSQNPRYENRNPFPLTIVINPKIVKRSHEKKEDWEGDLSTNLRGWVPRASACTVVGVNQNSEKVTYELADDFHARVFQHEIDHLDGIMFVDRVKQKDSLCEYEEWKKYWKGKKFS